MRTQPLVAFRSCEDCKKWLYDEKTGKPHMRHGKPVPRTCDVPCDTSMGCPKGHYDQPKSLSERNQMAYQHYRECKAVNQFPEDYVVRRNAGLIAEVEDITDRAEQYNQMSRFGGLASLFGGGSK